ncbi:class I alpha-mannosidase 1A [Aspergillus stella-maris]|uniref:class I alpha-mannosidase 1A n=1 Tax=Aspergillus stella-maris TaxID=1810926 RepID=UPI003CCC94CA
MFRARRYRISLVFAAIFVLLILHFSRSRDQPPALQVPPAPVDQQTPPTPNENLDGQTKNNNADLEGPARPPPYEQPPQQQQQPPSPQQPPYEGSDDTSSGPSVERPDSWTNVPSEHNENVGSAPQSGAQTQSKHDEDEHELDTSAIPHWKPTPEQHPIKPETLIKLPTGSSKPLPQLQAKVKDESSTEKMQRLQKLETIKSSFLHAWNGYKVSAMGHDEVRPLHGGVKDTFNGWGATLVDSLDTLWIMGLKEEFSMAVDYVKKIDFTTSTKKEMPVFETAIRYLGGMLGAYDISGHKYDVLLEKAVELADVLMGAFDTPNRMPTLFYRWSSEYANELRRGDFKAVLAEIGSLSLEFTRLAQLTKEDKYYDAIARITDELEKYQDQTKLPGLWPLNLDASGCRQTPGYGRDTPTAGLPVRGQAPSFGANSTSSASFRTRQIHEGAEPAFYNGEKSSAASSLEDIDARTPPAKHDCFGGLNDQISGIDKFGLGALGDSTYEYLPKEYMLLGGVNDQYSKMYEKAMTAVRDYLVFRPMIKEDRDVRFLATVTLEKRIDTDPQSRARYAYEGTHLTCFAGGMFAIGSKLFGLEQDMKLGSQLTDGCVWAYEATKTGIMPEAFQLVPCAEGEPCEWNEDAYYMAMDPYADKRPSSSHIKRSAEPEVGNWHVIATPETTPTTPKQNIGKSANSEGKANTGGKSTTGEKANTEENPSRKNSPLDVPVVLSHEEFVAGKIENDRLPPGMIGISARKYLLRPEAIESVFIMFRLTGDLYWREKGWKMFQAIDSATKTELANSAISDVTVEEPRWIDSMESFWLAETLKYFYLLFSDPSVVSLDEYVLNTEAHPFKRPAY